MGIGYESFVRDAARLGNMVLPMLVIVGLLALWAMIVVVCLLLGQGLDWPLYGATIAH